MGGTLTADDAAPEFRVEKRSTSALTLAASNVCSAPGWFTVSIDRSSRSERSTIAPLYRLDASFSASDVPSTPWRVHHRTHKHTHAQNIANHQRAAPAHAKERI
jgi:hypothetical protein